MDPNNENTPVGGDSIGMPQEAPATEASVMETPAPTTIEAPAPVEKAPEPEMVTPEHKSAGPVIGSIIIIVIIILGGLYFWGKRLSNNDPTLDGPSADEIMQQEDVELAALQSQSSSDEIAAIEADLTNTDLDGLDAELDNIDLDF